jgi:hypothetical protein
MKAIELLYNRIMKATIQPYLLFHFTNNPGIKQKTTLASMLYLGIGNNTRSRPVRI